MSTLRARPGTVAPALLALIGGFWAAAGCATDVDDRPDTFKYIAPAILEPNCGTAGCHSRLTAANGVQLDTYDSAYTFLVGAQATGMNQTTPPRDFVVPGEPGASKLMFLLRGGNEVYRMPPDQPLPDKDIDLIERWILDGAQKN